MANWKKVGIIFMYFMSVWLHITCEFNQNVYLLIHFDEGMRGGRQAGRDTVQCMDQIAQERQEY